MTQCDPPVPAQIMQAQLCGVHVHGEEEGKH